MPESVRRVGAGGGFRRNGARAATAIPALRRRCASARAPARGSACSGRWEGAVPRRACAVYVRTCASAHGHPPISLARAHLCAGTRHSPKKNTHKARCASNASTEPRGGQGVALAAVGRSAAPSAPVNRYVAGDHTLGLYECLRALAGPKYPVGVCPRTTCVIAARKLDIDVLRARSPFSRTTRRWICKESNLPLLRRAWPGLERQLYSIARL